MISNILHFVKGIILGFVVIILIQGINILSEVKANGIRKGNYKYYQRYVWTGEKYVPNIRDEIWVSKRGDLYS